VWTTSPGTVRPFQPGGNVTEGSPLANTQKIGEKNSKFGIERLYKNPKSSENVPKNEKNNKLLKPVE